MIKKLKLNWRKDGIWPTITDNYYSYDEDAKKYSNDVKYYKCTEIGYDDSTGRVNRIKFEQVKMSASAE